MYDGIEMFIFSLVLTFVAVIIAVRLSLGDKFGELFFQLKTMQKRLESTTESLNQLREEIAKRLQQGVATRAADDAEEHKDTMETPSQAEGSSPLTTHTHQPTGEDTQMEDVEGAVAEVTMVSEQQRVATPVATIEVPIGGKDTSTNTPEDEPQQTEDELQSTGNSLHQAETPAIGQVEASQADAVVQDNDAEQQGDNNEPQGNNTEEGLDNLPQEQPQLHVPVAAFAQDETAQAQNAVEQVQEQPVQEPVSAVNAYLESKHTHAATNGYGTNAPTMGTDDEEDEGFNYEKFIGENLFGKIGILVFVLGIAFFVKYAIDQNWIGHTMRTALGFGVGTLLLGIAWRLGERYRAFSSLLAGGGCAVYYVTTAIAFHYYQLFSQSVAFGIMVVVTLFMAWTARHYERRELAVTAIVGGFLAPFLTATGTPNFLFLYVYMVILGLGSLYLSWGTRWNELPLISTAATYLALFLIGKDLVELPYGVHLLFYGLFWVISTASCFILLQRGMKGAFAGFHIAAMIFSSMFTILLVAMLGDDEYYENGFTALTMGAAYVGLHLWLRYKEQSNDLKQAILLGLGLVYLSVSLPLFFSGAVLTVCLSAEMVLLLWLYCRLDMGVYGVAAIVVLFVTILGEGHELLFAGTPKVSTLVFNSHFMSTIFRGLCFLAFARIMDRNKEKLYDLYVPWNHIVYGVGIITIYACLSTEMDLFIPSPTYNAAVTWLRIATLFAIAVGFGRRYPASKYGWLYAVYMFLAMFLIAGDVFYYGEYTKPMPAIGMQWLGIACAIGLYVHASTSYYKHAEKQTTPFTVFLNVSATLLWVSMVRALLMQMGVEQFSAAFSLSLAAVGTLQMSLGMRLPNKTMRWLSICTFGVIIAKLALYDVWRMPAVGRIVVFIILGVLLLTLSFMYQKLKDTLNLGGKDEDPNALETRLHEASDDAEDNHE